MPARAKITRALLLAATAGALAAAPAQAVLVTGGKKRPINAFTIKLDANGTHTLAYGSGGLNRTATGRANVSWSVTPGTAAPLAFPVSPDQGSRYARSIAGGLKASGNFGETGTASITPPNPPADAYSCSGPLAFVQGGLNLDREVNQDKLFRVAIPSFTSLYTAPGSACSPAGWSPFYIGNNLDAASQAVFFLSQATLKQSVIKAPVSGGAQSLPCANVTPPCRQAFGWTGTVTLEKTCRNGAADSPATGILGDPGVSCSSPCKGAGCSTPVLGVPVPKQIIRIRDGNTVKVKVECYGGGRCRGRSRMFEVNARGTSAARRRKPTLGSGSFVVRGGTRKTVRLKLTRAGKRRLRRRRTKFVSIGFRLSGKRVGERRTSLPTRVRR